MNRRRKHLGFSNGPLREERDLGRRRHPGASAQGHPGSEEG
jgi:hypothetical protein